MNIKKFEENIKNIEDSYDILGRDKLLNFAILVSLVKINNEYHFLFQKRNKNISQGSEICFPGGQFDEKLDASFKDTAIRETYEELGISKEKIKIISKLDSFALHVYIENYLGVLEIASLDELSINKKEVEEIFTMPVKYFVDFEPEEYSIKMRSFSSEIDDNGNKIEYLPVKELNIHKRYENSWGNSSRYIYAYKTEYGTIWGITALIIRDTIKKYFK